ncbi:PLP-dependent transferase [Lactarius deliciosus]|nr:PLP-dependent transferase [Lactarius deliciosus]
MSSTSYSNEGSTVAPASGPDKQESRPSSLLPLTPGQPPVAVSGKGIHITLEDGREFIDAAGGAAVACIGNGHPIVREAVKEQVDKLAYVYNMQLSNEPAEELASVLLESGKGGFELCGFAAGGSEAMESAIKLARQYWFEQKQPQRKHLISRHMSLPRQYRSRHCLCLDVPHGVHLTRRILQHENIHKVSPAYAKRFQRADETEEQYVERLRQELEDKFLELGPDTVIGFVAETVVGASGVIPAPKGYFRAIKSVCRKYGALFILDEVMCGMGRMGVTHAWESYGDNEPPDIQVIGKSLGMPASPAVLMSKQVADAIRDSNGFWKHGHTYQAHPISCAAAVAVQKVIAAENLLENGRQTGEFLAQLLRERLLSADVLARPFTSDIRGGGSLWVVEFDFTGPEGERVGLKGQPLARLVQAQCFEKGLVVSVSISGGDAKGVEGDEILFAPAYNITREEVEKVVDIFVESVEEVLREHSCK